MKRDQESKGGQVGFGHSLPSKVVSCVASAALATMMVPAVALADGESAGSGNEGADSGLVKDLDGNGRIDVLLVGNSHAVDMTQYADVVAADVKTAGIGAGEVKVTALTPMGGRRLYTDDTGRGSHIAAATMDESKYSQEHTDKDSKGNALAQNKKKYDDALNATGTTYDLVVLQDWHESTNDSDASKAATGVADAVKWIKGSNYSTIKDGTKVAWAADWPDVANHESYQGNMAGAYNAVQGLTENKPDFIVPVGTAVENSRSSYFDSVKNASDAYITGSENTEGVNEEVRKYNITARDANHLSYELGCYTASATLVGSVLKAEGVETNKITEALKTAPVTAENGQGGNAKDVPHEWKGEFTDSTWDVVKESVGNALNTPGKVTQSKYETNPAYDYADAIEESDFSTVEEAADKAANQEDLENAAKNTLSFINPDIVKALGLTDESVACSYRAPISGTVDNPTGTAGSYNIKICFLYGYTKMNLTIASGKIKPTYAEGGQEALDSEVAKIRSEIEEYAKAFGYTGNIQELESDCFEDCYTVADVDGALNVAVHIINDETGVEDGGYITDNGWDTNGNPVGNWTGAFWRVTGAKGSGTVELFGKGTIPRYTTDGSSLTNGRIAWKKYMGSYASKVVINGGVSAGYLAVFISGENNGLKEIVVKDGADLRNEALYFNTVNNDLNIIFEGSATVTANSINWWKPQFDKSSRVYVYADSNKLINGNTGKAWGTNPFTMTTKNDDDRVNINSEGHPILTFVEQGVPSSDKKVVLLEKSSITSGGWDEDGKVLGDETGIYYEVYQQDGETVLEFSGSGDMPAYKNSSTENGNYNPLNIQKAPWRAYTKSVTKIKAGGGIGYAYLSIWDYKKAKEITFGDDVKLAKSTLHYNAGMAQDVRVTFEGKVSAAKGAVCIDYQRSGDGNPTPEAFKGQFTFLVDSSKTFDLNGNTIEPSNFISGNISKTNANGALVGTIIDTRAGVADDIASEGEIYVGGWDEKGQPVGSQNTGVRYKITTGIDGKMLTLYKDSGYEGVLASTPDYWATGTGDANLRDSRTPWYGQKYAKVIIESGVHVGKMALHVGNNAPAEIVVRDGASLGIQSIYYNSVGNDNPIVIFEGNASVAKGCFCSYNMGINNANAKVDVYGDLSKLTIDGKTAANGSDMFSTHGGSNADAVGKFVFHSYDNSVAEAMEKVGDWNGEVADRGLCASDASDDTLTNGVKAAVETRIGTNSGVTVVVKKIVKGYYEITLSKNVDGATLSKITKKQVAFEHNWGYAQLAGSAFGFKETCENCGQSTSVELVASDSGATRDSDKVKFTYNGKAKGFRVIYSGKLSTGNDLKIIYKDAQDNELSSAPTKTGTYSANISYGNGNSLSVPFTIEQSANLSVSTDDYNGVYDGKSHAVVPVVKGGDENNKITYSIDGGSTWTTEAPSIKDAGEKNVSVRVENPNFKTASCACELKVYKGNIDVTVENKTMTAGDKLPEFTYKTEGFVDGESFASVAGAKAPTLSCKADGKTAGTFDIVASDANAGGNYKITYKAAKLTVKAAPVTPSRPSNPDPTPTPKPTPAAPSVGDTVTSGEGAAAANFKVTAVAEASGIGGEIEYTGPVSAAAASNATVPESVSINGVTYVVTSIAPEAFKGATDLASIEIPATVVKVGASAFEGCTKLAAVKLPVGVKTIEARTFKGCVALKSVTTKAARIEASAFAGCTALVKLKAPNVKVISKNAFKGAKNLKSLTTGTSLTTIGASAFSGNKHLTSITVLSKHLSKASVKGSLKGSAIKSVTVRVGTVKANKAYAKKYAKLFTKKIAGKKATVTASKKPLKK